MCTCMCWRWMASTSRTSRRSSPSTLWPRRPPSRSSTSHVAPPCACIEPSKSRGGTVLGTSTPSTTRRAQTPSASTSPASLPATGPQPPGSPSRASEPATPRCASSSCWTSAAGGAGWGGRAGLPALRLVVATDPAETARAEDDQRATEAVAEALGVNVYAKQLVDGRDRKQLERLCRYVMRPPLSQERLEVRPDGTLELTLKSVWKDGTRALVLQPLDFIARLCSAIPPPWLNMVRYFGVLSSHSRLRARVVPSRVAPTPFAPAPAAGDQL